MDNTMFVLVISDLHVGGTCALMPAGFIGSTGAEVSLNRGQQYLLRCWEHFKKDLPQTIDALVINGDAVEGQNYADEARYLTEVDPSFQARAAAQLLAPLLDLVPEINGQKQVYMTRGSRYHVGRGGNTEEMVGAMIKAIPGKDRRFARSWLHLSNLATGVVFDIAHHQSFTIRYRAMSLEREVGFYLERVARQGEVPPENLVIVRSHTHVGYRRYEEDGRMAVGTPCWKLQDDFAAMSRYPNRLYSDHIGAVGFRVHSDDRPTGKVEVARYLYPHPQIVCEEIQ